MNSVSALLFGSIVAGSATAADPGEYARGASFQSSQAVAVIETDGGQAGQRLALVALQPRDIRDSMLYTVNPKTVDQFCNEGKCSPNDDHLVAVLPAGTVLTVTEIRQFRGFSLWGGRNDEFVIFALGTSPLLGGARVLDITDLSVWKPGRKSRKPRNEIPFLPNPRVLVRASELPSASAH